MTLGLTILVSWLCASPVAAAVFHLLRSRNRVQIDPPVQVHEAAAEGTLAA